MVPLLVLLCHPWMERGVPSQANPPQALRGCNKSSEPQNVTSLGCGSQRDNDLPAKARGGTNSPGCAQTPQKHKARRNGATRPLKGTQGSSGRTPRPCPSWEVREQMEAQGSDSRKGWGGVGLLGSWGFLCPGRAPGVGWHHKVPAALASALLASPSPVPQVPHPPQKEEFLPPLSQIFPPCGTLGKRYQYPG